MWIIFGRVCAVLFVLFLGIQAVANLLGESSQNLQLMFFRQHHVVCGLGRIGRALVRRLLEDGQSVVAIERDLGNEFRNDAHRLGALVLTGDATDEEMLHHARVHRAKAVYVVTGSDEANVEATINVRAVTKHVGTNGTGPECFVHIVDPARAMCWPRA